MQRQSHLFLAATIRAGERESLAAMLETMNDAPGEAGPDNRLVPFGQIKTLHVARFVILDNIQRPFHQIANSDRIKWLSPDEQQVGRWIGHHSDAFLPHFNCKTALG